MNALWMDRDVDGSLPRVLGHRATLNTQDESAPSAESLSSTPVWKITVSTVNGSDLIVDSEHHTMQVGSDMSTNDNVPGPGSGNGCMVEIVTCDSWDWTCILGWAAGATGAILGASACLMDPTKVTCGLFLFYLGGAGAAYYDCDDGTFYQDKCSTTSEWVTEDDLPDYKECG